MTILFDTNFYGDIMRGKDFAKEVIQQSQKILISPIVMGELLSGFKNGQREKENTHQFHMFCELNDVEIVPLTNTTAEFFALIIHQLRKSGTPLPVNDIWIAASAMEHGAAVATSDGHFRRIHNLMIVQ